MIKKIIIFIFLLSFPILSQSAFFVRTHGYVNSTSIRDLYNQNHSISKSNQVVLIKDFNLVQLNKSYTANLFFIQFEGVIDSLSLYNTLMKDSRIEYIQPNYTYRIDSTPNDSLYSQQWSLEKIDITGAWEHTTGDSTITIGVIDTGIDLLHPDLLNQIYINPAEDLNKNGRIDLSDLDGKDNDSNGFIDDISGFDFVDKSGASLQNQSGDYFNWDNDPTDENGHGTFVSGIIGAQSDNIIGIAGIAPNCKILPLRAFDPDGYGEEDDVVSAILYAMNSGVKVINMSFGDKIYSKVLRDIIKYASANGIIFVGSAGNSGTDEEHYPSGFNDVISVGNSNKSDNLSSSSTFGSTVDLVAPGTDIISTEFNGNYASASGTSASAPHVSGTIGLLLSINDFSFNDIKTILKSTSDDIQTPNWDGKTGSGRLNAGKAVKSALSGTRGEVSFISPLQGSGFSNSDIDFNLSVLHPNFASFGIEIGKGISPLDWTVIYNSDKQIFNELVYSLDLSNLIDTTYTARIKVTLTNNSVIEERVNFIVDRSEPKINYLTVESAYSENQPSIIAALESDDPTLVDIYIRKSGSTDNFTIHQMDDAQNNISFVKNTHHKLIRNLEYQTQYEVYFMLTNSSGLENKIDNNGENILVTTQNKILPSDHNTITQISHGRPFGEPIDFYNDGVPSEIIINSNDDDGNYSKFYKYINEEFIFIDQIENRIVKAFGDFNNDNHNELVSLFARNGYIDQINENSTDVFQNLVKDESGDFWPVLVQDLDNDSKIEIIVVSSDSTLTIYELSSSEMILTEEATLVNFSPRRIMNRSINLNTFNSANVVIGDLDNNGSMEIIIVDSEGDILGYSIDAPNSYSNSYSIETGYLFSEGALTAGDFDGDNKTDLAIILNSSDYLHIAPYYKVLVFNLLQNKINTIANLNFASSEAAFNSFLFNKSEASIKLADLNNDKSDDLIINIFPYTYIFRHEDDKTFPIYYSNSGNLENKSSFAEIYTGDLNMNGILDVILPGNEFSSLLEFGSAANNLMEITDIYSISNDKVRLEWKISGSDKSFVFRSDDSLTFNVVYSGFENVLIDTGLEISTRYMYTVSNSDAIINSLGLANSSEVYTHHPVKFVSVDAKTSTSLQIQFDGRVDKDMITKNSFFLNGSSNFSSIAQLNQNTILVQFESDFSNGQNSISIKNLRDYYNSPIADSTFLFPYSSNPEVEELYITSFKILNSNTVQLNFNLELDFSSIDPSDFSFTPSNQIEKISNTNDPTQFRLSTKHPINAVGIEYSLQLSDIYSSVNTNSVKLKEGAGSVINLSSQKTNLSEMYVFPNPFRTNSNNVGITFANLVVNTEISIYSLSGSKIITIIEDDNNGGVSWDLKDDSGETINSGIYIYRAILFDDMGNETEVKTGKFAVVR
ncbi:MAG: S8 family serine peptidase [Melioribacteraceae bacterium]|nr:S8 family serine peptidase [Melioribacteraceae bacterium]MCF8432100.1 S8 family serine peptidase [Melioribacteraceae bacterium]